MTSSTSVMSIIMLLFLKCSYDEASFYFKSVFYLIKDQTMVCLVERSP